MSPPPGFPYAVAVECVDGASRFPKISCRDADKVAIRALKALHFVGGTPQHFPLEPSVDRGERRSNRPHGEQGDVAALDDGNRGLRDVACGGELRLTQMAATSQHP